MPGTLDPTGGSLDSFAAVIDALAAERSAPRSEIVRRMIEELEDRIAVDRATIALLRRIERDPDPAAHARLPGGEAGPP